MKTWAQQEDEGFLPKQCPVQEGVKGKEHEPKSPHILHATKDKHQHVQ